MSILAALQKSKQAKQQELEQVALKKQSPEDSYWKYKNGVDGKDGYFIGDDGFRFSLQLCGLDDTLIEDWLTYQIDERERILDYYNEINP